MKIRLVKSESFIKLSQELLTTKVNKKIDLSKYSDLETIGIGDIIDKKGYQDYGAIISMKLKSVSCSR